MLTGLASRGWSHTQSTLPARHWKWRMRGSAALFAGQLDAVDLGELDVLLASSYLPMAELVGLCPEL